MDAVGESGPACSSDDATHFQNLNAGLGSLAEVESMSQVGNSPYTLMAGLGVNGAAGSNSTVGPTAIWPQIFGGEGGPVASDPAQTSWYVNNSASVSIYRCTQSGNCTPAAFGASPVVDDADVAGDGNTMTIPAPFIVDPLDNQQLLVGTCRLWRGTADGTAWTSANAISPILDGISGLTCSSSNALIRTISAMPVADGEVIYVGMFGTARWRSQPGWSCTQDDFGPGQFFDAVLARCLLKSCFERSNAFQLLWPRHLEHLYRSARFDRQHRLCDGRRRARFSSRDSNALSHNGR